jgi:2-oxo-3-hexenedioate decarboxylase
MEEIAEAIAKLPPKEFAAFCSWFKAFNAERVGAAQSLEPAAAELLHARDTGAPLTAFTTRPGGLSLPDAYRVTAEIRSLREARGERVVGRKIGFTNRTIWDEYNVHAPIWGYVYDTTLHEIAALPGGFALGRLPEPRIEPEIAFGLKRAPQAGLDDAGMLACIDWMAHGFEVVQSPFPGWRFEAPDTVAAFGLHGALLLGPRVPVAGDLDALARALSGFTITLSRNGEAADRGAAVNVLDGPLAALRHLVEVLAGDPGSPPLAAGEIVTTGTLTRALPIAPGETWSTQLHGIDLAGVSVRFV